jgi:hypothetical protein
MKIMKKQRSKKMIVKYLKRRCIISKKEEAARSKIFKNMSTVKSHTLKELLMTWLCLHQLRSCPLL